MVEWCLWKNDGDEGIIDWYLLRNNDGDGIIDWYLLRNNDCDGIQRDFAVNILCPHSPGGGLYWPTAQVVLL